MPEQAIDKIVELARTIVEEHGPHLTYDSGGGEWKSLWLLTEDPKVDDAGEVLPLFPGATVAYVEVNEGATYGWHSHFGEDGGACTEIFVALGGIVEVATNEVSVWLSVGSPAYSVPPGELHNIKAVTDAQFLVATIPTAGGLPRNATPRQDVCGGCDRVCAGDGPRASGASG